MSEPPLVLHAEVPSFLRAGDVFCLPVTVCDRVRTSHAVEVVLRTAGALVSAGGVTDAQGRIVLHLPPCQADAGRTLEGELDVLRDGRRVHRERVSVPILAIDSAPQTPTVDLLSTSPGIPWRTPVAEGIRVERVLEDMGGQVLPRDWEGWRIPHGEVVRVRLSLAGRPGRAVHLVDPTPAGLDVQGLRDLRSNGCRHPEAGFEVREGQVEICVDPVAEGRGVVTYLASAKTSGAFLLPPARAEESGCPDVWGRTGWDIVGIDPSLDSVGVRSAPILSLVRWEPADPACGRPSDLVSYDLLIVDGTGRAGYVRRDGSVWERTHDDARVREILGYCWCGVSVPPLLVSSPLGALASHLEVLGERLLARPWRGKRRASRHVAILPGEGMVREGTARRIRARLRELGCPRPHVEKP